MRNVFIWEGAIDWSYITPIAKHLSGENFYLMKKSGLNEDKAFTKSLEYYKPDNIIAFRYETFNMIKDTKAIKYQFYHGVSDKGFKYVGGQMWRLGMHYDYFVEAGEYGKEQMINKGKIPADHVVALGYPKLDTYKFHYENRFNTREELGIGKYDKVLFYAPTCREENSLYSYMDVKFDGEELGQHLENIVPKDWYLVIKTHDDMGWLDKKIKELNNPRIKYVKDYSSSKYLAIANILLGDFSSINLEAMAIGKPVIQYINCEERYKNRAPCDWWDYTIKVHNLTGLHAAIQQYIANPILKINEMETARKLMFNNLFSAGKKVAEFIEEKYASNR